MFGIDFKIKIHNRKGRKEENCCATLYLTCTVKKPSNYDKLRQNFGLLNFLNIGKIIFFFIEKDKFWFISFKIGSLIWFRFQCVDCISVFDCCFNLDFCFEISISIFLNGEKSNKVDAYQSNEKPSFLTRDSPFISSLFGPTRRAYVSRTYLDHSRSRIISIRDF